jgi:exonuclease III
LLSRYQTASVFCRSKFKNGGSAILIKEGITYREKKHTNHLNDEKVLDHCVFEVCLCFTVVNVIVVALYRSSDACIGTFLEKFETLIGILKKDEKPLVICGDLNIDCLKKSCHLDELASITRSFDMFTATVCLVLFFLFICDLSYILPCEVLGPIKMNE